MALRRNPFAPPFVIKYASVESLLETVLRLSNQHLELCPDGLDIDVQLLALRLVKRNTWLVEVFINEHPRDRYGVEVNLALVLIGFNLRASIVHPISLRVDLMTSSCELERRLVFYELQPCFLFVPIRSVSSKLWMFLSLFRSFFVKAVGVDRVVEHNDRLCSVATIRAYLLVRNNGAHEFDGFFCRLFSIVTGEIVFMTGELDHAFEVRLLLRSAVIVKQIGVGPFVLFRGRIRTGVTH